MKKFEKVLYIICIASFVIAALASSYAEDYTAALYATTSLAWCSLAFKFRSELK